MAKVKFEQLGKKDKNFRIANLIIMGVVFASIIGITIYHACTGDPHNRVSAGVVMAIFALVPYLIELIFRTRLPNGLFLGAEIYLVITGVWGSLLLGYIMFDWLDIVIHTCMGFIFAMVGLFVISRLTDYSKMKVIAVAVFCFVFSLGIELVWELGEWTMDNLVGQTAQGPKMPEYGVPLVTDTMFDLLCNFSGSLAFAIYFLIGKFSKCSLGVNAIEKELTGRIESCNLVEQSAAATVNPKTSVEQTKQQTPIVKEKTSNLKKNQKFKLRKKE